MNAFSGGFEAKLASAASYDSNVERRRRAASTIGLASPCGRTKSAGKTIGSNSTRRLNSDGSRCAAISRQVPPIECPKADDRGAARIDERPRHRRRIVAVAVPVDRAFGLEGVAVPAIVERDRVEPLGQR